MATTDFRIMGIIGAPDAVAAPADSAWDDLADRVQALEGFDSFPRVIGADGADNASTISTSNYSAALEYTFTLPDGEWTITVLGFLKLKHSGSSSSHARIQIAGDVGTAFQYTNLPSATYEMCQCYHLVTGVTGGSKLIRLEYKSNAAGTTSADNPCLIITCKRDDTP